MKRARTERLTYDPEFLKDARSADEKIRAAFKELVDKGYHPDDVAWYIADEALLERSGYVLRKQSQWRKQEKVNA